MLGIMRNASAKITICGLHTIWPARYVRWKLNRWIVQQSRNPLVPHVVVVSVGDLGSRVRFLCLVFRDDYRLCPSICTSTWSMPAGIHGSIVSTFLARRMPVISRGARRYWPRFSVVSLLLPNVAILRRVLKTRKSPFCLAKPRFFSSSIYCHLQARHECWMSSL